MATEIDDGARGRATAMIVVGLVLAVPVLATGVADPPGLMLYTFGDRSSVPIGLRNALCWDAALIAGYGLFLGGCALKLRRLAVSDTAKSIGKFAVGVVKLTVLADVLENVLLFLTRGANSADVSVAVAAGFATVKWCALLVAIVCAAMSGVVYLQRRAARSEAEREAERAGGRDWWVDAIQPPERPEPVDPATQRWSDAYNVPGAQNVIDAKGATPVTAICLSGGGVRSACVAMGAMQVFSEAEVTPGKDTRKVLDTVDYVISVSGGGYTAGARLMAVQPDRRVHPNAAPEEKISNRYQPGSPEFSHFRGNSSYIADSTRSLLQALGVVLKNMLASAVTLFWVPVALGLVSGWILAKVPMAAFAETKGGTVIPNVGAWWAVGALVLAAVATTVAALRVEQKGANATSESKLNTLARLARTFTSFAALTATGTVLIPALMWLCSRYGGQGVTAGAVGGVLGLQYVATIVAMVWANRSRIPVGAVTEQGWRKKVPAGVVQLLIVILTLAVLAALWLVILGSVAAGVYADQAPAAIGGTEHLPRYLMLLAVAIMLLLILALCFSDVTSLSLHPFYRLRLARTFAVRRVSNGVAKPYDDEEPTWLDSYGQLPDGNPRFVFCAAATITGEGKPAPGLNAVSFVMTAEHIGGPDLGWLKTGELLKVAPPRIKRDLTVQAAVAVSGAAFASAMGRASKGFQTLLAVSGARLGTWLPNPAFVAALGSDDPPALRGLPVVRGFTYFYRELLSINKKNARLVQVTDGGHYENLGLVEALRRRCGVIYCIDGGGDTPPLLEGLSDAMRLAKYELGVEITLDAEGSYAVQNLAPGSGAEYGEDDAFRKLNDRITAGTVILGTITYPPAAGRGAASKGRLIFAKAVLWDKSPYWLLTYAAGHDVFPHDSTSDQWFNEGQFAAYTELGRIIAQNALHAENAPAAR